MEYPTLDEIDKADRLQLAKWYRFLPLARSDTELKSISYIVVRFNNLGGWDAELSKEVGYENY